MSLNFFSNNTQSAYSARDLLITIAGSLLSVFVLINVLVPQQQQVPISKPTSEDQGVSGLFAMYKWLTDSGVNTLSLRKPVSRILDTDMSDSGNVMLISLPYTRRALESEWSAVNQWIARGNTAVVFVAGLYDRPGWMSLNDVFSPIKKITASEFSLNSDTVSVEYSEDESIGLGDLQEQIDLFKSKPLKLSPMIHHPLFNNIKTIDAKYQPYLLQPVESDGEQWEKTFYLLKSDLARLGMGLMKVENSFEVEEDGVVLSDFSERYVMWLLPVGDGWVYLSAFPDLLSNSMLKESENARWFTQLLQQHLSSSGYVIFNDYPFGLSDLYDADAFFSDKRLHYTFVFVALFWLTYALAFSPRLAPVRVLRNMPDNTDFIEASAGFFSRRLKVRTVSKALSTALIDELKNRTQLKDKQFWDWLQDHPDVYDEDVVILKHASGEKNGKVKLIQLTQVINRIYRVFNRV